MTTDAKYTKLSLSLHSDSHFSRWTWVSQYQKVSILAHIGTKDDGGGGDK